jgi:transcriptional regulator with XRE-family HTH domain
MPTNQVSKAVKEWRTGLALNLTQAAGRVGVSIATLFQWEAGASLPSPMAIPALAACLGTPAADLSALVARERTARLVGGGRKRKVVGSGRHVGSARPQHRRAGAA